jgi:hypothetical protein
VDPTSHKFSLVRPIYLFSFAYIVYSLRRSTQSSVDCRPEADTSRVKTRSVQAVQNCVFGRFTRYRVSANANAVWGEANPLVLPRGLSLMVRLQACRQGGLGLSLAGFHVAVNVQYIIAKFVFIGRYSCSFEGLGLPEDPLTL